MPTLRILAEAGRLAELQAELRTTINLDSTGDDGTTALHLASTGGHLECARALIEAGADVDALDAGGWTPLHVAITEGRIAIVDLLLKAGADTSIEVDLDGQRCDAMQTAELQQETVMAEMLRQANRSQGVRAPEERSIHRIALRCLGAGVRSPLLAPIWALEALNYGVHACWRPVPWNSVSVALGYGLWALQLWCLFCCQLAAPTHISDGWRQRAAMGTVPSITCPQTGDLLPPRARYVRRAGGVVLGFDHFCYWLGTPIGIHNRKAFVLFVSYSAIFLIMGTGHSLYEITYAMPVRMGYPPFPWANTQPLPWRPEAAGVPADGNSTTAAGADTYGALAYRLVAWLIGGAHGRIGWFVHFLDSASGPTGPGLLYTFAVGATVVLNVLAAILMACFALFQFSFVLTNQTALTPRLERRFDVGWARNWQQVMGSSALLWTVPIANGVADGHSWPVNANTPIGPRRCDRKQQ